MNYLEPTDEGAFVDFPTIHDKPSWGKDYVLCIQCHGHGGWNLSLNSYSLPRDMDNTPDNRHRYVHFRAHCSQCNGYGWTAASESDHIHKWNWSRNTGNCLNVYACSICKQEQEIDSSG